MGERMHGSHGPLGPLMKAHVDDDPEVMHLDAYHVVVVAHVHVRSWHGTLLCLMKSVGEDPWHAVKMEHVDEDSSHALELVHVPCHFGVGTLPKWRKSVEDDVHAELGDEEPHGALADDDPHDLLCHAFLGAGLSLRKCVEVMMSKAWARRAKVCRSILQGGCLEHGGV